ncbi:MULTISPECIES: histidine phosphatase family protein [unclassified Agromyces]|uniref:histidine phosphatase family protein n=1 Tax=unclassified Agromyces TaxID=2639701 RepID=UPI0030150B0D
MIVRLWRPAEEAAPVHGTVSATTIALVRHGETDWNRDGRIQGSTDIAMNDRGRRQARATAARLAAARWDAVVTSPLSRSAETAGIIARRLGLPEPGHDPALAERRHGILEGLTREDRRRLEADAVPIEGLESRVSVVSRAVPALLALAGRHPGGAVVAVTHGGVIQSVLLHLWERAALPSGSVANGRSTSCAPRRRGSNSCRRTPSSRPRRPGPTERSRPRPRAAARAAARRTRPT